MDSNEVLNKRIAGWDPLELVSSCWLESQFLGRVGQNQGSLLERVRPIVSNHLRFELTIRVHRFDDVHTNFAKR